ncbi:MULTISPECIES: TolC family protein [unclassified Duganella]|uniref:TolC family protein n=1 Tax=unclassified Duganella TaxID=2636909 RepID=UPI000E34C77F|nr:MULTISPECIES: TolC family protein [unclassified Duganella]RFP15821.1 TolC family protein [Duganella sp. BJB475]RFP33014.1 TolC family protein [Duganella sp. BJB476]
MPRTPYQGTAPVSILNRVLCASAIAIQAASPGRAADALIASMIAAEPHVYCGAPAMAAPVAGAPLALAELIAIGMKQSTDTRVAWSQAEEAALNLGIARSKYGPILAARAAALHEHSAFPLPKSLNPNGYFKSDAEALVPALTLKWLLYDGGGREAVLDRAGQQLASADFGFSAAHRRVTIQITQQFYRLSAQTERLAAAQDALHSAQAVEQLAQARHRRGLGTAPEALQAGAQASEAQLQMEAAGAAAQDAYMALLETAGTRPDANLCIALPATPGPLSASPQNVARLVERAMASRPEVQAALAQVRAGDAAVRQARSEYGPKLLLAAHAGQNLGRSRSDGGDWSVVNQPVYGVGLVFDFPLYDGQIRRNELRSAQSKQESAEAQLDGVKNKVVHEVVKAYHDLAVAQRRRESSAALLAAASRSFDATLASYRQGLATMPELQSAMTLLARARSTDGEAGADLLTARAVLSFASGDLMEVE